VDSVTGASLEPNPPLTGRQRVLATRHGGNGAGVERDTLLLHAHTQATQHSRDSFFDQGQFVPSRLGDAAEAESHLRAGPEGSLWRYQDGVYRSDGDAWLGQFTRSVLGEAYRDGRLREVRSYCRNRGMTIPTQPSSDYLNLRNGLLFWRENPPRLAEHSPEVPSIIQLPVAWDPQAESWEVMAFLGAIAPEEDDDACLEFLSEWLGYLLIPDTRFQRALMLEGPRDTGKSTFLRVIEALLGENNVTHRTLQSISDDRFAAADLYGKLANVCADLDAKAVQSSGKFKMVVSGDRMTVEHKYGQPFSYRPHARLIFSANEAPGTADQSDAYFKRWLVLPMHRTIPVADQDARLVQRLATPAELSGLLRHAVEGLKRLMARGRFEVPPSMGRASEEYRARVDTVVAFAGSQCTLHPEAKIRPGALYESYRAWCSSNGRMPIGNQRFGEHLLSSFPGQIRSVMRRGYGYLLGIGLREDALGPPENPAAKEEQLPIGQAMG
jgi:putative DNA primase/helicase